MKNRDVSKRETQTGRDGVGKKAVKATRLMTRMKRKSVARLINRSVSIHSNPKDRPLRREYAVNPIFSWGVVTGSYHIVRITADRGILSCSSSVHFVSLVHFSRTISADPVPIGSFKFLHRQALSYTIGHTPRGIYLVNPVYISVSSTNTSGYHHMELDA